MKKRNLSLNFLHPYEHSGMTKLVSFGPGNHKLIKLEPNHCVCTCSVPGFSVYIYKYCPDNQVFTLVSKLEDYENVEDFNMKS